jgi:hypothetical protein
MTNVDFKMFVDRPGVMARVNKKRLRVLAKTGDYGRKTMRSQIRPIGKKHRKPAKVTVNGIPCLVPYRGMVLDARTNRPVRKAVADAARKQAVFGDAGHSKPGAPPKSISGELRKRIYFGIDDEESVVIGPALHKITKGNQLLGGLQSVPQLLNEGGRESLLFPGGERKTITYEPRPFVDPIRPTVEQFFITKTKETPL